MEAGGAADAAECTRLGMVCWDARGYAEAVSHFRAALRRDPRFLPALLCHRALLMQSPTLLARGAAACVGDTDPDRAREQVNALKRDAAARAEGQRFVDSLVDLRCPSALCLRGVWVDFIDGNYDAAVRLYTLAGEAGCSVAAYNVGVSCAVGEGTSLDMALAEQWYRRAMAAGHASAAYNLGVLHDTGDRALRDRSAAAAFYESAVAMGHTDAAYNLGLLFDRGDGVQRDFVRAAALYRLAANAGDSEAAYQLARMFEVGDGVECDTRRAVELFTSAADAGHAEACCALGMLHLTRCGDDTGGCRVAQDRRHAARLLLLAAELGSEEAKERRQRLLRSPSPPLLKAAEDLISWFDGNPPGADQVELALQMLDDEGVEDDAELSDEDHDENGQQEEHHENGDIPR
eukprot:TRINITY_DN18843_c0_g1_i1.p1 TRINITY_DN18843_c0_g1~~TRINITY_DN18843_c0_g1_i1.p1  ORF type:complete len:413 (+),score=100.69 TRINITY_DN18843_c0_g1_i1:25-1239(+)